MARTSSTAAGWRNGRHTLALPPAAEVLPLALALGVALVAALLTGCAAPAARSAALAPAADAVVADPHMVGLAARGRVGRSMDKDDRLVVAQALETAPVGTPLRWDNDETAYRFELRTVRDYAGTAGRCREYAVHRTAADGGREQALSRACRRPDGDWRLAE